MTNLKTYQRIALDTFLSEYLEPVVGEFTTFDILIDDIRSGNFKYCTIAEQCMGYPNEELAEQIDMLATRIWSAMKQCSSMAV